MPGRNCPTVAGVVVVLFVLYAIGIDRPPVDFSAYYRAALDLRAGRTPYHDALVWKAVGYVTGSYDAKPTPGIAYVYPPALGRALVALTALSVPTAYAARLALLFGAVIGTAWCLATLIVPRRHPDFWLLIAVLALGIALFKPVRGALTFSSQVDPLIMLLLAGTLVAFVRRRDGLAGLLLGLAIAVKPFVVVLVLVPLWKGAYRLVIVAGLVSAMLVLGPLLALGLTATLAAVLPRWSSSAAARRIAVVTAALVLFLMLPATQVIDWGFYRYQSGPIPPPLSFTTFLFLAVMLSAAVLNVMALRLFRRV